MNVVCCSSEHLKDSKNYTYAETWEREKKDKKIRLECVLYCFPVILDEKAEVAMAILPFVIQPSAGTCNHKDFLEFISISVVIH